MRTPLWLSQLLKEKKMAKPDDDPLEFEIQKVLKFLGRRSLKSRERVRLKLEIHREHPNRVQVSIMRPRFSLRFVNILFQTFSNFA